MEFAVGDVVRQGFGFANPNHAAAAICAAFPFCWGWRGAWRWAGRLVAVALYAMLAVTCSRTGTLVDYGGKVSLSSAPVVGTPVTVTSPRSLCAVLGSDARARNAPQGSGRVGCKYT
ncbi:MAG: hypothetical protein IJG18_00130 [Kiritimatiellae bacterium]|nr:hypothetical protein [Kiritimatiellia bacterium]